ncbi:hypothetical protein FPZ12_032620 [Amycolatopsis acidicola]|uniref:Uncharacterized protein n=1 Tax=Amycolatopsis acidicola TaxID=2596893 RepID=A0A5N0URG0_9PSEU|nr:hypothetical protein [Amycolatopsis acidicola]KAA9154181.1 hypothetical protein FPZ12_032620 [Amycolatopsis acidicola]
MYDEVSVTELLEREGWTPAERPRKKRLPTVAVMLAVIVGCGLAAVLVHFGAQDPQADSPSLLNVPHLPTGGLAGGGIPWDTGSEVTGTESSIVVTEEAPPQRSTTSTTSSRSRTRHTETSTVTVTGQSAESSDSSVTTTNGNNPGSGTSSSPSSASSTATSKPGCWLLPLFC